MARYLATAERRVALGAVYWTLSAVFFAGQAIAQAASTRPYSLLTNAISDLGVTACGPFSAGAYHTDVCSPLHGVMNGTFIVTGVLYALGALSTRPAWPARRLATWGLALIAVAGAGQALVGIFPADVNGGLHTLGALFGIPGLAIGVLLLGLAVRGVVPWLGLLCVAAGVVGVAGFLLTVAMAGAPFGLAERVAVYPPAATIVVLGARLLAVRRPVALN